MAEVNHDLLEVIQMAIKLSKLEQHPVGSLWATMSDDDPAVVFGGGVWQKLGECRVLQCADDDHPAGTTEEAGLPNIKGELAGISRMDNAANGQGVFQWKYMDYDVATAATSGPAARDIVFDASIASSIYGKSDTVQMKSIYCNIWQRIK